MREKLTKIFIFTISFIFVSNCLFADTIHDDISSKNRSDYWKSKNQHLIPELAEFNQIMKLDSDLDGIVNQKDNDIDGDGILNDNDDDIDGDGVLNRFDPSAYDWRETGYNPFGVLAFLPWDHSWNNNKYPSKKKLKKAVQLIKTAGIKFVRMDFIWGDIEPRRGRFDFDKYDYIVDLCAKNNIRILGVLSYSVGWAAKNWNNPPDKFAYFTNYCKKVVSRYKNRVKYWEIWNEPDSPTYWYPQDEMKTYTKLLKSCYRTIKKEDLSAKVVLGGLTAEGYYPLKNIYRNGGKDFFDIVNIHPFINPFDKDGVNKIKLLYKHIRNLMDKYQDYNKKIWFTEVGVPGVNSNDKKCNWWQGRATNESQQANFLKKVYNLEFEDVDKIFWAYFRDNKEHFCSGVDYFGLIRWNYFRKPSYHIYRRITSCWKKNIIKKYR